MEALQDMFDPSSEEDHPHQAAAAAECVDVSYDDLPAESLAHAQVGKVLEHVVAGKVVEVVAAPPAAVVVHEVSPVTKELDDHFGTRAVSSVPYR